MLTALIAKTNYIIIVVLSSYNTHPSNILAATNQKSTMKWTRNFTNILVVYLVSQFHGSVSTNNTVMIRLQDGSNECKGRLEATTALSSNFESTCDRDFGTEEAKVICRQLGCPTEYSARVNADK